MRMRFAVGLFVVLFVAVSGIWAGTVPVNIINNSFEAPPEGATTGAFVATGWSTSPSGANGLNPAANTFQYIPDGTQVAYANNGYLFQVLGTDIAPDTTYTLSVYVSQRVGGTFTPNIELIDDGTTPTAILTMNNSTPGGAAPSLDGEYNWVLWTGQVTTGASVDGAPLEILLGASAVQTNFDDVTLNASVPEPAMFALVGVGLLGLVTRRRFAK